MTKYTQAQINSFIARAEQLHGPIHPPMQHGRTLEWHECVALNHFWFNTSDNSTRVIRIKEPPDALFHDGKTGN